MKLTNYWEWRKISGVHSTQVGRHARKRYACGSTVRKISTIVLPPCIVLSCTFSASVCLLLCASRDSPTSAEQNVTEKISRKSEQALRAVLSVGSKAQPMTSAVLIITSDCTSPLCTRLTNTISLDAAVWTHWPGRRRSTRVTGWRRRRPRRRGCQSLKPTTMQMITADNEDRRNRSRRTSSRRLSDDSDSTWICYVIKTALQ